MKNHSIKGGQYNDRFSTNKYYKFVGKLQHGNSYCVRICTFLFDHYLFSHFTIPSASVDIKTEFHINQNDPCGIPIPFLPNEQYYFNKSPSIINSFDCNMSNSEGEEKMILIIFFISLGTRLYKPSWKERGRWCKFAHLVSTAKRQLQSKKL